MKRTKFKGGKMLALAVALLCSTASLGSTYAYADTAQDQAAQAQAAEQAFVPAVSGQITSCKITGDKQNIEIGFNSSGDAAGTDGKIYIFEMQPFEDEIGSRRDYAASAAALGSTSVTIPLNLGTPQDRLYSRFMLAVYDGADFLPVSKPHYITNPEIVAKNQEAFKDPLTKKGLNIEIDMLSDAFDLGVKHVTTNIAFSQIMGTGITYNYDGVTYNFNKAVVDAYDETISALSGKGMTVTVILLNDWNPNTPDLIYPGTQKSSNAFYYMFNAQTENGFEQTKAIASFLADHYSGKNPNYGKVSNWIIGNEINNQQWNYMGSTDLTTYVKAYQKAFRVIYTAIKSTNANDRVYFSLDYNWMNEIDGKLKYGGKQIVDSFNSIANTEGQMEWGLAYHPYPCPMTEPEFWDDPQSTGLFTNDFNSPVINFANLNVLTDYFVQETLRTPSGHVRHIILTEQGFTSYSPTRGNIPEIQAAAYAYSYYLVDSNPYIDAYTVSRQVDAPSEAKDGLKFGLWECDMNQPNLIVATKRKKIWQVFRDIDKKNATLEATEFAKPIIGISKWSDVVPDFKWRNLEN
ncbi:Tat pathway signal protein [Clostridiales bacterium TF09-2AC]|nr:Tat pathway signal protein [Clostridiales bacterium TF09-2AC]